MKWFCFSPAYFAKRLTTQKRYGDKPIINNIFEKLCILQSLLESGWWFKLPHKGEFPVSRRKQSKMIISMPLRTTTGKRNRRQDGRGKRLEKIPTPGKRMICYCLDFLKWVFPLIQNLAPWFFSTWYYFIRNIFSD